MMHATTSSPSPVPSTEPSNGGRLVSTTGRSLPLLGTVLSADAGGGIARVTLEQRFRNPHAEPLAVTYSLPLPADGAVSGFCFTIGDRRVVGEIDRKKAARERYEQALVEGRSAALLEQDRSSLFTQEIGNIPPGVEVIVEVSIDQRLAWLDEGAWEWRFPTVAAPRYVGEEGRVTDATRIAQDVAAGPLPARFALGCTVRDRIADGRRPESPTHAIDVGPAEGGERVTLREKAGARLDRDIVVRWRVATPRVGLALATAMPERERATSSQGYGLLTVVPPSVEGRYQPVARDLIVLLDTSGSMGGEPLSQAVRVVSALVETLRDRDQLELIEFGSAPRRWKAHPVSATEGARREAIAWLRRLHASGGTEMRTAIVEALAGARPGAQRQVVLVTDGLIGFESQVVAAIRDRLPASSRLHTVGVGSSVNRSLTGPAARAGHGVEVVIGLGEDPERAAARVVARTDAPLLVDLVLGGSALVEHAPSRLPDLFGGAPALIGVALRPEGGELVVTGRTPEGSWEQRVRIAPMHAGTGNAGITALFGREKVEDLEMALAAGGDAREVDRAIEKIGIDFQISTRLTSWVAVSQEQTVDPSDPLRRERMPHELPHGMSAEGLGLRPMAAPMPAAAMPASPMSYGPPPSPPRRLPPAAPAAVGGPMLVSRRARVASTTGAPEMDGGAPPPAQAPMDRGEGASEERAKGGHVVSRTMDFLPIEDRDDDVAPAKEKKEAAPPPPRMAKKDIAPPARAAKPMPPKEPAAPKAAEPAEPAPETRTPLPEAKVLPRGAFTGGSWMVTVLQEADGALRAPHHVLKGRVALHRAGLLVIEILAGGAPLAWAPGGEARVALVTGHVFTAQVDAARTTRPGEVPPGATARLALTLDAAEPTDGALSVTIELDGVIVIIELG